MDNRGLRWIQDGESSLEDSIIPNQHLIYVFPIILFWGHSKTLNYPLEDILQLFPGLLRHTSDTLQDPPYTLQTHFWHPPDTKKYKWLIIKPRLRDFVELWILLYWKCNKVRQSYGFCCLSTELYAIFIMLWIMLTYGPNCPNKTLLQIHLQSRLQIKL